MKYAMLGRDNEERRCVQLHKTSILLLSNGDISGFFITFVSEMNKFNDIQNIKRHFFAMRNGIIADTLRKAGSPYRMIFGLNLPQVQEIAASIGKNAAIAESLHADTATRESQLLAPMIMPPEEMTIEKSLEWLNNSPSDEATDILCHRLLRHLPHALDIAEAAIAEGSPRGRYGGVRLMWNLIPTQSDAVYPIALQEASRGNDSVSLLARNLMEEIDFLRET